jgi:methylated-DNA-[protein]-cysteine S-methyltransferase
MATAYVNTPLGLAQIEGDEKGISSVSVSKPEQVPPSRIPKELQSVVAQLLEYFEGNRKKFDLPLNPKGTFFQKKVWEELQKIPYGKTISYLELSKKLGDPKAIRAVAAANGKNPIWIIIPCHRVVGSQGDMVGYAGGIHRKKWLLNHESPSPQHSLIP